MITFKVNEEKLIKSKCLIIIIYEQHDVFCFESDTGFVGGRRIGTCDDPVPPLPFAPIESGI